MPIALTVSHAFVDGAHISLFFEKVEKYLKEDKQTLHQYA